MFRIVPRHPRVHTSAAELAIFGDGFSGGGVSYTFQNLALHTRARYVRNMADGRVDWFMEGPDGEINIGYDVNKK